MRSITLRDLEDLGWQRFEDLVAALVLAEHPAAEKLSSPDGGADVLLERPGQGAKAWQVKHFPRDIHWDECVGSLDAAVEKHGATEVVFVFPRNMSYQVKKTFNRRLGGRHPGVEVSYVPASQLIDKLRDSGEELVTEFFGRDPRDQAQEVARHLAAEGLQIARQPGSDPIAQRFQLADEAGRRDRYFRTEITLRTGDAPISNWSEKPSLLLSESNSDRELRIAAWPEKGQEGNNLDLVFDEGEEGERARWEVVRELASRGEAALPKGARARLNKLPEAIRALTGETNGDLSDVTLRPTASHPVTLSATQDGRRLERTIVVVVVPPLDEPLPGFEITEFGGLDGEVSLFLTFHLRKEELKLSVKRSFALLDTADYAGAVEALRFLVALDGGGRIEAPTLLSKPLEFGPNKDLEQAENHRAALGFFENLRVVEEALEVGGFPIGEEVSEEEGAMALLAARLIEGDDGSYNNTFVGLNGEMSVEEVAAFEATEFEQMTVRFPVEMELLGKELYFGIGEAQVPKPEEIEIEESEEADTRRINFRWPDDPKVPFKLIAGPDAEPETGIWAKGRVPPPPQ